DTRYAASRARWAFFEQNGEQFDDIYDKLVQIRARIADKLGYPSFTDLAYDRLNRTEYGAADVATFRDEIRTKIVPLAVRLREQQRERRGVDRLMAWDEPVADPRGNPRPGGGVDWMVARAM